MATKPRHLKTPLQLWVVDNRKRLGLTPADLASVTGVTIDTARGWESRGGPSEDALTILERRFGVPRPQEVASGRDDLAAAINALVEELRTAREERERVEVRLRALEVQVGLHAQSTGGGSLERSVLRATTE